MPVENTRNVRRVAMSPDGAYMLTCDVTGRSLLINVARRAVLAHLTFHEPVHSLAWSPDGKHIAVGMFRTLEVWTVPTTATALDFAPFRLVARVQAHFDKVVCVNWSANSCFICTAGADNTAKIFRLDATHKARPLTVAAQFSAHSDRVVACFFGTDDATQLLVVTRDARLTTWAFLPNEPEEDEDEVRVKKEKTDDQEEDEGEDEKEAQNARLAQTADLRNGRWVISAKQELEAAKNHKVKCVAYHRAAQLLVLGYTRGVFAILGLPDLTVLQRLSVSRHSISSVAVNASGEWVAFGSKKLGQLLVWEWRSESYVMKQQGHHFDMRCLAYSPNGKLVATGGDDGKVKIWDTKSWFCFVTFSDHTAPVTGITFAPNGLSVVTSSLDGTVRAFDLIRYRNYRTLVPPEPVQLGCVALDAGGEIVAAGSVDHFDIYVWSLQTGKVLDVLSGHEGPVASLAFSPTSQVLASASWDHTARVWDTFEGRPHRESLVHGTDCVAVAWKPDGSELCCAALDGTLNFWDPDDGVLLATIEGANDISGGRYASDARMAATNPRSRAFTAICYSPDGSAVLAAGESKYVCLYDIAHRVLLRRFQTTHNLSLDGVLDMLSSRRMTEAGPLDSLVDQEDSGDESDDGTAIGLPGAKRGPTGERATKPAVATRALAFAPDGHAWAAATTEGMLVFSIDDYAAFDPCELDVEVTAGAVARAVRAGEHLRALLLAFRLGERACIDLAFARVPVADVQLAAQQFPLPYLARLLAYIAGVLEGATTTTTGGGDAAADARPCNLERCLLWGRELLLAHAEYMATRPATFAAPLHALHKQIVRRSGDLARRCLDNRFTLEYIASMAQLAHSAEQHTGSH